MSDFLPILEELEQCQSHAERRAWLMSVPNYVFHREHLNLRRILDAAGHHAAIAYAQAKLAEQTATRLADGSIPITILSAVYIAETDLKISAREGG
ncbi:hypothetical protein [Rhizobium sp. BK602]|uniref:hypothetical protein n=1 Tax=Rhizobium sp. BK602 TaxID=2586986 RepID=UPI001615DCF3|nr:hypothetical protein [Rhizobium sp. BK602]MBB3608651.1 hypothetical protein [Rhizobium sp. BK602]